MREKNNNRGKTGWGLAVCARERGEEKGRGASGTLPVGDRSSLSLGSNTFQALNTIFI